MEKEDEELGRKMIFFYLPNSFSAHCWTAHISWQGQNEWTRETDIDPLSHFLYYIEIPRSEQYMDISIVANKKSYIYPLNYPRMRMRAGWKKKEDHYYSSWKIKRTTRIQSWSRIHGPECIQYIQGKRHWNLATSRNLWMYTINKSAMWRVQSVYVG